MLKRIVMLCLAVTLVTPVAAEAHHRRGPCNTHWRDPGHPNHEQENVERLVRICARHFGVDVSTAVVIAGRESSFRPRAYNPTGCEGWGCKGVYQHHMKYWPDRTRLLRNSWDVGHSPFNARANILITMRMVDRGGWGPWSL
jgi:hypothetical protein